MDLKQDKCVMNCDSQNTLHLTKKATYHCRTKHIDMRYYWIHAIMNNQEMLMKKIRTSKNLVDMLTKVVNHDKHQSSTTMIGLSGS